MGTISDTHPDLPKFITAKQTQGRLTNFNVSVLISDAFMEAVKEDADWDLYFPIALKDRKVETIEDADNVTQYVYSTHKARDLWSMITKATYEYSEPGVIFIDRVNDLNNLKAVEQIHCTNPCGEQPLPPHGCCNLGAVNLARMVHKPFTPEASFSFELLQRITTLGIRFLDSVIDVASYPLDEQRLEETNKRRLGLGVSGLADCLAQLRLRYGSPEAINFTDKVFNALCQTAYSESCSLAEEKGSYPLWNKKVVDKESGTFASQRLDYAILERIKKYGLRNGMLLTVAPTGTTSILFGNVSSGIEPVFDHKPKRNVRQADNSYLAHETLGYGAALYARLHGNEQHPVELPSYMVTCDDLSVEDHITTQATVQRWIDASVSKTCNISEGTTYEQFVKVYDLAYALGCKGCTTYRPSDTRGNILSREGDQPRASGKGSQASQELLLRPEVLQGVTHKIKWPSMTASLYLTVNYNDGLPHEVFLASKDGRHHDWMTALTLMITSILRRGGDISFVGQELQQVHSFGDTAFLQAPGDTHPMHYGSLPAYIGAHLATYLRATPSEALLAATTKSLPAIAIEAGEKCPKCQAHTLERKEGCKTCASCGYSDCG